MQTVFARTQFAPFERAVNAAAGEEEFVTFEALSRELNTPLWRSVNDSNSELRKLLEQPAFQSSSSDLNKGQIDKNRLIMFGILNCQDTSSKVNKVKGLYNVLQDGGLEAHQEISAQDKDFKPTFKALCVLATQDVFAAAHAVGDVDNVYDDDEVEKMVDSAEELGEDVWLDAVYGYNSRMKN